MHCPPKAVEKGVLLLRIHELAMNAGTAAGPGNSALIFYHHVELRGCDGLVVFWAFLWSWKNHVGEIMEWMLMALNSLWGR